jgi:acylphosphatase
VKRAHVRIRGRVQAVGFRYSALLRARSLGVAGWIRNSGDGSVEGAFEGDDDRVQSMLEWCRRGPSGARVDDVEVGWEYPLGESGFEVR